MFKATVMKTIVVSCLYLYLALGIYFAFDNAFLIPDTNQIATAFVVGLVLDVFVIDTICAFVHSLVGGSDRHVVGDKSPV